MNSSSEKKHKSATENDLVAPTNQSTPGPGPFALHQDSWGRLVLTDAEGQEHVGVEPVRSFPVSDPAHGVSICDAEGRELVWIESLAGLPEQLRLCLEEELASREFVPVLLRILKVSAPSEPADWEVETDRGYTRLRINSEEDVRRLANHRAMVMDANGLRYLIPDTRTLDAGTARVLERYL